MKGQLFRLMPERLYLELWHQQFKKANEEVYKRFQEKRRVVTRTGYSLKPFDDTKSIFIHTPKCAGVSVSRALYGNLAGGHATLNRYLSIFEPELIRNYFKFAFVRNPWDRVVSAYHFLKNGGMNETDKNWADRELKKLSSFDQFVREWLSRDNVWRYQHFRPQHHYVAEKRNKVFVDFVGFFENVDNDFQVVANRLRINQKLAVSNRSDHRSYMSYYNAETIEIVRQVYAEDIQMFGYTYNNSSLEKQIGMRDAGHKNCLS